MDFALLDGIDANKTDPCTLQFLAAPICLLYKNLANKIVPIAIQVGCCLAPLPAASPSAEAQGGVSRAARLRPPGKKVLCGACPEGAPQSSARWTALSTGAERAPRPRCT